MKNKEYDIAKYSQRNINLLNGFNKLGNIIFNFLKKEFKNYESLNKNIQLENIMFSKSNAKFFQEYEKIKIVFNLDFYDENDAKNIFSSVWNFLKEQENKIFCLSYEDLNVQHKKLFTVYSDIKKWTVLDAFRTNGVEWEQNLEYTRMLDKDKLLSFYFDICVKIGAYNFLESE